MTRTFEQRKALFKSLGKPASVFIAIHLAKLVLPHCNKATRPAAKKAIAAAQAWLDCHCEEHSQAANAAADAADAADAYATYAAVNAAVNAAYAAADASANAVAYTAANAAAYAANAAYAYAADALDVDAEIDKAIVLWKQRSTALEPAYRADAWSQP